MNKQQAIKVLEFHVKTLREKGYDDIHANQAIEVLKQPPTLAEFLGWEENTEYETEDGIIYRIINDKIYYFNDSLKKWICSSVGLNAYDDLRKMKKDKKVEDKKYYLKHKFLGVSNDRNYLKQAICDDEIFMLSDKFENEVMRTQFTLEEIEEIKEKYGTDLKDFDLIEVEDESN